MTAPRLRWRANQPALRSLTAAALVTDAIVHFQLAHRYDLNGQGGLSQGELFRVEAGVAVLAAALVLLAANRITWALAAVIAASAFGAVLVSTYVDIGAVGPVPDMFEPYWYPSKVVAALAEGAGTLTALTGLGVSSYARGGRTKPDW